MRVGVDDIVYKGEFVGICAAAVVGVGVEVEVVHWLHFPL